MEDTKSISKKIAKEINFVKKWIAERCATKMHNELINAYNSMIDDFYSYRPESQYKTSKRYIRHFTSSSDFGKGVNLYKALVSELDKLDIEHSNYYTSENEFSGGIMFNPEDRMASHGYRLTHGDDAGKGHPENVFNAVVGDGVRFPETKKRAVMLFQPKYKDYTGYTPKEILDKIVSDENLKTQFLEEAKSEAQKELTLKWVSID